MIPVTKPYLPNREKLNHYIDGIYERNWLTNNGPLVQQLTERLKEHLDVEHLLLVSNGTLALQVAYRALDITNSDQSEVSEAITTPFTFIATASSLKWEGVEPIFSDINANTWCLDPSQIEEKITSNTKAIVPVHVFGNACDVEAIDTIAQKYNLKVIYDAAHAFGVTFKDKSLLNYGDAAILSFHATKLFHSIEGGAIVFKNKEDLERAKLIINFGISSPDSIDNIGINAKMNEFQAAMGLCVLDELESNLTSRAEIWNTYAEALDTQCQLQKLHPDIQYNYAYFPIVFDTVEQATQILNTLKDNGIIARRYFYPSLDTVDYFQLKNYQPISNDIASRILCLPIYSELSASEQYIIINSIKKASE
ncbi:DegT/DnrJ/EryC1/StrS family aminotransferase [Psychrobacter faecalis]|uniref:DegT/DnrJ/EryC1/StrS family aminotransferase n=1 Tax=Psychrobacter faecalis TaxID=180588 RepID=UPI00191B0AFA|nr:DegT/DnrJ/EryC1/StrS family aminotransferase [Psychrobacter faecalis]